MKTSVHIPEEIVTLFKRNNIIKTAEKGSFLFREGMPASKLYVVKEGRLRICKVVADGRELSLKMCKPGDILGELGLFQPDQLYSHDAKVIEDTEIYILSKVQLENKLIEHPDLMVQWLKWVELENKKYQSKVRDLMINGKKGALYSTIVRLCNSFGVKTEEGILIDLSLTNQEIANFCGTSREMVNRLLNELKNNEIITFDKGYFTIKDLNYIKGALCCENCPIEICQID
ncbi:CRP/FNR family transcriptional regulator [Oikeobacillus pervagus]|uniref:CRP/FNR family transcriptional regulator n=1 Tax=Oikeobacillus pervagus TaxID=1325931 RepID=A0AAJ1T6B3_9BACI|nr:Crp/Fnr family transcriptional regulator [Oikeobacillus pervagus]MDQ0216699.1 CRP/FNR family transcriptional regulator [Oikeobacillus pervagus]